MERVNQLAPCGVYCGACPSFEKTCFGCSSEDRNQNRRSKWSCKIRNCCYDKKGLDYCAYCDDFPCRIISKKLFSTHIGEPAFEYRQEIPHTSVKLKTMGVNNFLKFQREKSRCESCDGTVLFYTYKCKDCGRER